MRLLRRVALLLGAALVALLVLPPLWYAFFPRSVPDLPPSGRRVEVSPGVGVNVLEEGAGPPVVLVHGHPACSYDFAELSRALAARGHRVLAYDRVGYGHSDGRRNGAYTVDSNAAELLRLLAAEDLRDVTLVGWSYGGATSIVATRTDPSRIARLVLVGAVGPGIENRGGPEVPPWAVEFLAGPVLSWLTSVPPLSRRFRDATTAAAFDPDPVPPGYRSQLDANFGRPHTLETYRSEGRDLGGVADLDPSPIRVPTLVVHGDADLFVPLFVGEEIHRRAPASELWVVEKGSHMLPITHAEPLAERVAGFARSTGGETP